MTGYYQYARAGSRLLVHIESIRPLGVKWKLARVRSFCLIGFSCQNDTEKCICGDFCGGFHHKSKSPQLLVAVFTTKITTYAFLSDKVTSEVIKGGERKRSSTPIELWNGWHSSQGAEAYWLIDNGPRQHPLISE